MHVYTETWLKVVKYLKTYGIGLNFKISNRVAVYINFLPTELFLVSLIKFLKQFSMFKELLFSSILCEKHTKFICYFLVLFVKKYVLPILISKVKFLT